MRLPVGRDLPFCLINIHLLIIFINDTGARNEFVYTAVSTHLPGK